MFMQRNQHADHRRDDCTDDPVVHAASNLAPLQGEDFVLRNLHSPRLTIPNQHLDIRFQSSQFFQYLLLELMVDNPNHQWHHLGTRGTSLLFDLHNCLRVDTHIKYYRSDNNLDHAAAPTVNSASSP